MTELKEIINYVLESINKSNLSKIYFIPEDNRIDRVSTNMILDCAVRIYNSQSFKGKEVTTQKEKEVVIKSVKVPASDKQKYALINFYGYTESEVDEMDMQLAYDTIKKEKEIELKEKNEKH